MSRNDVCLLAFLLIFIGSCATFSKGKSVGVIYGTDDRKQIYEGTEVQQQRARSVAAVVPVHNLKEIGDSGYAMRYLVDIGRLKHFSPNEPYSDEPVLSLGTAFLIAPDRVVTAGHVISSVNIRPENLKIVFGYDMNEDGPVFFFPEENVYSIKRVLIKFVSNNVDFAVLELDRDVVGRDPLVVSDKPLRVGDGVYTIGHPWGIPKKIAENAEVKRVYSFCFSADLDAFSGNSGSPIFNMDHEVVGVLYQGRLENMRLEGNLNRIPQREFSRYFSDGIHSTKSSVFKMYSE